LLIQREFLEKRSDDGMLRLWAKFNSSKSNIYDTLDDGCQEAGAMLKK